MDLRNVYFVIGTSYAGKSTIVKNLAAKHNGIALEENYHDELLESLDKDEFPCLTYTRDLQDWHDFIRRSPIPNPQSPIPLIILIISYVNFKCW